MLQLLVTGVTDKDFTFKGKVQRPKNVQNVKKIKIKTKQNAISVCPPHRQAFSFI